MNEAAYGTNDDSPGNEGLFPPGADLSDRLGPMTVKELRQGMRRGSFVIPFIAIQLLAILATGVEFKAGGMGSSGGLPGLLNVWLLVSSGPFWFVVSLICVVVMPLGGLAMMTGELDSRNHELVLLTRLSRWQVVWGKFLTLWGLCLLTFVSLLPYVVVRYLVGGIEPLRELACSGTLVALSGMFCAGAIGASAFQGVGKRIVVLVVFFASMGLACGPPLVFSAHMPGGFPVLYHLNALVAFGAYVLQGLALARARMRLDIRSYEVKPSWIILGVVVFTPPAVWMSMAVTLGYGGFAGLGLMAFLAFAMDPAHGALPGPPQKTATAQTPGGPNASETPPSQRIP